MKKLLFISTLVAFVTFVNPGNLKAQSTNTVFVELLGNGLIFSANYDMRFNKDEGNGLGARLGVGYIGGGDAGGTVITVPAMVNYLLGKDGKYLEIGGGVTYVAGSADFGDGFEDTVIGTLSIQYRRQPVDGGFMWKIGLTPIIASGAFIPYWPGVSIGYCW